MPIKKYFTEEEKLLANRTKALKSYHKTKLKKIRQFKKIKVVKTDEEKRIADKEYREKYKDRIKQAQRKYYNNNKYKMNEKRKEYLKNYYNKNKEKALIYSKNWRINNIERYRMRQNSSSKKYYMENKNMRLAYARKRYAGYNNQSRAYAKNKMLEYRLDPAKKAMYDKTRRIHYSNNKEKIKSYSAKWRKNNPNYKIYSVMRENRKRELRRNIGDKSLSTYEMKKVKLKFNEKCFNCGDKKSLEFDHHYPLSLGNPLTLSNAVLLCKSCNSSKSNKLPESFYSPEQLTDLQLNYGISKSPLKEEQPSLFEARMPKNLERDNGILEAMNAA